MNKLTFNLSLRLLGIGQMAAAVPLAVLVVCSIALRAESAQAAGQCYEAVPIKRGNERAKVIPEVCQALTGNLNEFCNEPPMVCRIKISPEHPKLSLPEWAEIDIDNNLDLLEKLVRGGTDIVSNGDKERWSAAGDRKWAELRKRIDEYSPKGKTRFMQACLDVSNSGNIESIYKLDTGYCDDVNFGAARNETPWRKAFSSMDTLSSGRSYAQVETFVFLRRHAEIVEIPEWRRKAQEGAEPFPGAKNFPVTGSIFLYEGKSYSYRFSGRNITVTGFNSDPVAAEKYYEKVPSRASKSVWIATVCAIKYLGH